MRGGDESWRKYPVEVPRIERFSRLFPYPAKLIAEGRGIALDRDEEAGNPSALASTTGRGLGFRPGVFVALRTHNTELNSAEHGVDKTRNAA